MVAVRPVEIPPNTPATVRIPQAVLAEVTEGGRPLAAGDGIASRRQDGAVVVVEAGSGLDRFAYPLTK